MNFKIAISLFNFVVAAGQIASGPAFGAGFVDHTAGKPHEIPVSLPANAPNIISDYGETFNRGGGTNPHVGMDIEGGKGTPVLAMADGKVIYVKDARSMSSFDRMIYITHFTDEGENLCGGLYNGVMGQLSP